MLVGKFYIDENGRLRAEYDAPYEVLGYFLVEDVQASLNACDQFILTCYAIAGGRLEKHEGVGNASYLSITADRVHIAHEYADWLTPVDLRMEDFIEALQSWKELIQSSTKPKSRD